MLGHLICSDLYLWYVILGNISSLLYLESLIILRSILYIVHIKYYLVNHVVVLLCDIKEREKLKYNSYIHQFIKDSKVFDYELFCTLD